MIWTIIKKGTNGDKKAPPITDDSIKYDFVAVEKGRKILYSNEEEIQIKTVFFKFELNSVIKVDSKHYKILSASMDELPFITLNLKELPNV